MGHVMLALVPGTMLYAWLIDGRVIGNLALACLAAVLIEWLMLALRKRSFGPALSDGSILLAAWLLVLCVPPALPAWQLLIGVFVMTAVGKHLFGGLGHNPFNPAMVAYAVLIVSFPVTMTDWQSTLVDDSNTVVVTQWDGVTGATALDRLRAVKSVGRDSELSVDVETTGEQANRQQPVITREQAGQLVMSSPWVWTSAAWLAGGLYLLYSRIISWHIPVSVLGSLSVLYVAAAVLGNGLILPLIPALFSGAIMLGAFFIATDPVSAAASRTGKLVYGTGIGVLTFIIREYSVYPEGLAFAVLLMNICVPLIDHLFTRDISRPTASGKSG